MSSGTTYVVTLSLQTQGNLGASVGALGAKASQAHGHVMSLRHAFNQVGEALPKWRDRVVSWHATFCQAVAKMDGVVMDHLTSGDMSQGPAALQVLQDVVRLLDEMITTAADYEAHYGPGPRESGPVPRSAN